MVWRNGLLTAAGERPYYLCAGAAVWLLIKLSRNMAAALAFVRKGSDVCAVAGCLSKAFGCVGLCVLACREMLLYRRQIIKFCIIDQKTNQMVPEFRKANRAIEESQFKFFNAAKREYLGEPFNNIESKPLREGNRIRQNYLNDLERNVVMTKIDSKFELDRELIKENPTVVYNQLNQAAKEFAAQEAQLVLTGVNEITELTGNIVDGRGEFSIEHFYEMLERIEIPFNNEGKPILPMIVGSPGFVEKFKEVLSNDEKNNQGTKRMDRLIEMKRKLWYDRENNRKLVD